MNLQVETAIEFTEFCNLRCNYCCQSYTHRDKRVLDFRKFKIFMNIFLKEISKNQSENKRVSLDISLLGGELSVLYEQNEYFKYFEYLKEKVEEYDIRTRFILLTNFTGNLEFFQRLIDMHSDLLDITIHITLHESFYTTEKKIERFFNKINSLQAYDGFILNIAFLESDSPEYIRTKSIFDEYVSSHQILNKYEVIIDKLLKIGHNEEGLYGDDISYNIGQSKLKYCNVRQFEFDFDNLLVIDQCRGRKSLITSWKMSNNFITCEKICPYPSLHENFTQLTPEEYKDYYED